MFFKLKLNPKKNAVIMQHFFGVMVLLSIIVLGCSYFNEYLILIKPGIFCELQRVCFYLILFTALLILFSNFFFQKHTFYSKYFYKFLNYFGLISIYIYILIGVWISYRHSISSQFNHPLTAETINPTLKQLTAEYSILQIFWIAIEGKLDLVNFIDINMKILGLPLADWVLIVFMMMLFLETSIIYKIIKKTGKHLFGYKF